MPSLRLWLPGLSSNAQSGAVQSEAWISSLKKSGLKLSDPELLHLTSDLPSALGRYPVRAGLSGLSLDARVFSLSLAIGFDAFQSALECFV